MFSEIMQSIVLTEVMCCKYRFETRSSEGNIAIFRILYFNLISTSILLPKCGDTLYPIISLAVCSHGNVIECSINAHFENIDLDRP